MLGFRKEMGKGCENTEERISFGQPSGSQCRSLTQKMYKQIG